MTQINKQTKDIMKITTAVLFILFMALLIGLGPLATIWSMNLLFNTQIAYSFWTWLAMVWLSSVTVGGINLKLQQIKNLLD
jgi:antibiotic biosynthesis monooxygenase (ABM) superfamily enzyme